nr:ankyrin repeat family protein [Tanacetum cinerariifolium]
MSNGSHHEIDIPNEEASSSRPSPSEHAFKTQPNLLHRIGWIILRCFVPDIKDLHDRKLVLKNSSEVLKVLKNSLEVLKVLKNSLEVLKVLQMELQENSSIDEVGDMSSRKVAGDKTRSTNTSQLTMSAYVARSHSGDGEGKGKRKPNLGGRAAGMLNTRDKTRNLSLKEITDTKGPVPIQFELRDKQTVIPLGDHADHWSSYIGEVIRGVPLNYPSWLKVPKERKAALIIDIG